MDVSINIMKLKKLKMTVLFICKHNSARSQMAEGLLKELYMVNLIKLAEVMIVTRD